MTTNTEATGTNTTDSRATGNTTGADTFASNWQEWHAARVHGLIGDPHGWLSVVALDWLAADQSLTYADGRVSFARLGDSLRVRAISPDGTVDVDLGTQAPQFFEFDGVRYELLLRVNIPAEPGTPADDAPAGTAWVGVRVRDPKSALLAGTHEVPSFAPDPAWVVEGSFTAFDTSEATPSVEVIDTAAPGLRVNWPFIGTVDFDLDGKTYHVKAGGDPATGLSISFHDETNGADGANATSAWRAVSTGPVRPDGTVDIDFNRSTNFPAGFTVHATCPAPAAGNTIDVPITAGEQVPWRP